MTIVFDENGNEYEVTDKQFMALQSNIVNNPPEGTFRFDKSKIDAVLGGE